MKIISLKDIPEEGISHDPELTKKVIIREGELPHLKKFAQAKFSPGQIARAHSHQDQYEVFLIQSGTGIVKVNSLEYQVSQGDCVIFSPSEVHEVLNSGSDDMILTYFGLRA